MSNLLLFVECYKLQRKANCIVTQELHLYNEFDTVYNKLTTTANPILIVHCHDAIDAFLDHYKPKLATLIEFFRTHPGAKMFYITLYPRIEFEGIKNIQYHWFYEYYAHYYPLYKNINIINQPITNTFLCLNKRADITRWLVYKNFYTNNLLDISYFSFLLEDKKINDEMEIFNKLATEFEVLKNSPVPILYEFCANLQPPPIPRREIDGDYSLELYRNEEVFKSTGVDPSWQPDPRYYQTSFCSVIIETYPRCSTVNFSEKTFRAICHGHPFILIGAPYSLQALRTLGFDVYDDVFDHYYDTINNNDIRLVVALKEVDRIAKLSIDELEQIREKIHDRKLKNAETYKKLYTTMTHKNDYLIDLLTSYVQS